VKEYQHFFPSNPGARKVHDGQATGSCCFTASAEGRQVKAFASTLANISDAAIQLEAHSESFARLISRRVGIIRYARNFRVDN
jgi:hypothetical protein